jgi:pimeloyl-ACP methyl ester carboxylesterase
VLQGERDPFFPPAHGADLVRRIPGARIESIADAGHALEPAIASALAESVLRNVAINPR